MFRKIVITTVLLSMICSAFADAANAPAPSNTLLAKRIADLEYKVKVANQFIETQKIFNQLINDSDTKHQNDIIELKSAIYDPGNMYDMIKQNHNDIGILGSDFTDLKDSVRKSDGVICRLKQVENVVFKYGTNYHSYEPVCIIY